MKIVIIGTGNVAVVLGKLFRDAGLEIVQVFGRDKNTAEELASELGCAFCNNWNEITKKADVYLVAISDRALFDFPGEFQPSHQVVLHTAGAVSKDVLAKLSLNYGVLYPLQSLRKNMKVLTEIPFLADANNQLTRNSILQITSALASKVYFPEEKERLRLHVAAVCVNNFCNHLYTLTADFCQKENIDFSLLGPIALETAERLQIASPRSVVTGPAIRNDEVTISRHLEILTGHPLLKELYEQITRNIQAFHFTATQ